jgi:hypothetical protein
MDCIKTYKHIQILWENSQNHVEITVKIYMQRTQAKPINIKTCINTQHVN